MANMSLVRKALSVATSGESISAYLPDPLAQQVLEFVREINLVRRLVNVFTMRDRTWKKPKRTSGSSAYYIPDGITATLSDFVSTTVTWEAKKLMNYIMVDEEAIEDSQPDVIQQVLEDAGDALGEAFDGIFTVADASGATEVAAGGATFDEDMVNEAIYNLGKYGRNKGNLFGIMPPDQAANVRMLDNFKDASKSGLNLASFITGMGSAGEGNSVVTVIYGVPQYEAPLAPEGEAVIMHKKACEIGDRRRIKMESDKVIESDQRKYVTSERIAFQFNYTDMTCLIKNLSTDVSFS